VDGYFSVQDNKRKIIIQRQLGIILSAPMAGKISYYLNR